MIAIHLGKLGSWSAAKIPPVMFRPLFVPGMKRRKKSCADITTKRSTKHPLSFPLGPAPPLELSRRIKFGL
jgi:hypothetical protein